MTIREFHTFQTVAKILIAEHLGRKWKFRWHNGLSSYGTCEAGEKEITMSKPLTMAGSLKEAKDTLGHEIAHGMTPDEAEHHGEEWIALCKKLGVNYKRTKWERVIEKLRAKVLKERKCRKR